MQLNAIVDGYPREHASLLMYCFETFSNDILCTKLVILLHHIIISFKLVLENIELVIWGFVASLDNLTPAQLCALTEN